MRKVIIAILAIGALGWGQTQPKHHRTVRACDKGYTNCTEPLNWINGTDYTIPDAQGGDSHPLGKKGAGLWDAKPLDCIGCGLGTSESITYEGNIGLGVGVMVSSVDPKHPIVDLRFVQIRADIKYCDQLPPGRDTGEECVVREIPEQDIPQKAHKKPISRTVVGPAKPIPTMDSLQGKCKGWVDDMKGVMAGDYIVVSFAEPTSKISPYVTGELYVNAEAYDDHVLFQVCNPTTKPVTPDIVTFLLFAVTP